MQEFQKGLKEFMDKTCQLISGTRCDRTGKHAMERKLRLATWNAKHSQTRDTLRDLNVSSVRDEIKRLNQRHADGLKEYPNILAIGLTKDARTPRRLEKEP